MKKLLLLVLLLTSTAGLGADNDKNFNSLGVRSCPRYLEARTTRGWQGLVDLYWIAGYITAFNRHRPNTYNVLGGGGMTSALLWLDGWCWLNLSKDLSQGLEALTSELYPQRYKTKKDAGR